MDIIKELEKLRRQHYYCEDRWYSCPKSEDGCANELSGSECDCGADEDNAILDGIIKEILHREEGIIKFVKKLKEWHRSYK